MAEQEQFDTEITLGVGRLLVLFFGLVVLCGIFLGIGYSLGRNSVKQVMTVDAASGAPVAISPGTKPGSAQPGSVKTADCPSGENCGASAQDLSFYKSVEQSQANAQLTPAEPDQKPAPAAEKLPPPEIKAGTIPGSGYMVQIAAVSKKEDADALVEALRHKQYPVFVTTLPADKLYHVQIGPFPDTKEAESMRARLMADGYNPILKR